MNNKEKLIDAGVEESFKQVPLKWYEARSYWKFIATTFIGCTTYSLLYYLTQNQTMVNSENVRNLLPHIYLSTTLFGLGHILDLVSTAEGLDKSNEANDLGLGLTVKDRNPLLKSVRSSKDLFKHPLLYPISAAGYVVSIFFPSIGISLAAAKVAVSLNNFRQGRRTDAFINSYFRIAS